MPSPAPRKRILIVEDEEAHVELIRRAFHALSDLSELTVTGTLREALELVDRQEFDLVITDYQLPDGYARELVALAAGKMPVVMMTSHGNEQVAVEAIKSGALDYVVKLPEVFETMPRIVDRALREWHLIVEHKRAEEELHLNSLLLEKEIAERQKAHEVLKEKTDSLEKEISERLKIEEKLKESIIFNQQIITSAKAGIIVYDRSLRYQVWNPFMEELSGIAARDVLGRHPLEVFPFLEEPGVVDRLGKILDGDNYEDMAFPFQVPQTGKKGWASDTSAPLRNAKGEIIGVIGTVRDISAYKNTEEQLRHSQKLEAVGQLAGGVAHDFNNILTVITGYCSIMQMDRNLGKQQLENIDRILSATEKASQLTRGLLAFSRKQVMDPKVQNLNDVVQNVQKFLVRIIGEDIQLKTICNDATLKVKVDAGQIEQVLINLATNGRDAMPNGGVLSIETGRKEVDSHYPDTHGYGYKGCFACVSVSDTGMGMDRETCQKIFEPFFTTKETGKGTGLGMAIVHGIINQHGGFISVYSEPGTGTTFNIYLPLVADEHMAEDELLVQLPPPENGTETILVAEDEPDIRIIYENILSQFGYTVILAHDGQDAVEKFAASRDTIKLIIMDLIMPKMGGKEASAEIKKYRHDVKILFSSGYTKDIIQSRGELEKGEELLMKPVRPMELLRKLREMLDS